MIPEILHVYNLFYLSKQVSDFYRSTVPMQLNIFFQKKRIYNGMKLFENYQY